VSTSAARAQHYLWQGVTRRRVDRVDALHTTELSLTAVFLAPGQYNLNRFRFTVSVVGVDAKPRVFFFPLQHIINITSV
jgi:hypothetical protein